MAARRSFFWLTYVAGWLLFGAFEALGLHFAQHYGWGFAADITSRTVVSAAVMGLLLWWLGLRRRPFTSAWLAVIFHLAAASLYTVVWLAVLMFPLVLHVGLKATFSYSEPFLIWQLQLGLVIYAILESVFAASRAFERLRAEERRANEAEMLRVRAELETLRAKLQPHFLFNTLHTITALVRMDPAKAEDALLRLGEVLRYVLAAKSDPTDDVTLGEEWRFVQQYLEIEKIRLGDRLRVDAALSPEAAECTLPLFSLQPLVENAIHYAIAPRTQGGRLTLKAAVRDRRLEIEIADDGPGATPDALAAKGGLGLSVVRQRLETRFPGQANFKIVTQPNQGFRVCIAVPAVHP